MSQSDILKKSIEEEIEQCDDFLKKASDISDIIPSVQERKEEAEAKAEAINSLPDEVLDEVAPQMLYFQTRDRERLSNALPILPNIDVVYTRAILSTGFTSSYIELIASVIRTEPILQDWAITFMKPFNDLTDKQDRVSRIRDSYSYVQSFLGDLIDIALVTTSSARVGGTNVDHACMRLRDVLEKVWGEICDMARSKLPAVARERRLRHGTVSHRRLVAESLSPTIELIDDLEELLKNLSKLHSDLSKASKDPFNNDLDYLEDVYSRWILHLFNLSRMLDL